MISIVVPIPPHQPYYAHTIIANVAETCGLSLNEIDFVYLLPKDITSILAKSLIELKKQFKFRVILAPFNTSLHLTMIDYAMRHGQLREWVFLQHCDVFWKKNNWLRDTIELAVSDVVAVAPNGPTDKQFSLNNKRLPILHDYVGAYHRPTIVNNNISFIWGKFNQNGYVPSKQLLEDTEAGRWLIHLGDTAQPIQTGSVLDGSWLVSMELHTHRPNDIRYFDYDDHLYHIGNFVRITNRINQMGSVLNCKDMIYPCSQLGIFAWVSSIAFDLEETPNHLFPYYIFEMFGGTLENEHKSKCEIMCRYSQPRRFLGLKNCHGIDKVVFKNKKLEMKNNRVSEIEIKLL